MKEAFGAVGDGVADDTAALQAAFNRRDAFVFIPDGTYLVRDRLIWDGKPGVGPTVQGQSRDGVVIRLADDAPGIGDPDKPRAVVLTVREGKVSADYFKTKLRNLTVDAGDNLGAVGVLFHANNSGQLRDVTVRGKRRLRRGPFVHAQRAAAGERPPGGGVRRWDPGRQRAVQLADAGGRHAPRPAGVRTQRRRRGDVREATALRGTVPGRPLPGQFSADRRDDPRDRAGRCAAAPLLRVDGGELSAAGVVQWNFRKQFYETLVETAGVDVPTLTRESNGSIGIKLWSTRRRPDRAGGPREGRGGVGPRPR